MAKKKKKKIHPLLALLILILIVVIMLIYYSDGFQNYLLKNGIITGQTQSDSDSEYGDYSYKYSEHIGDFSYLDDFTIVTPTEDHLKVHFINIGQGDCIFIELPDKKTVLIDSGNKGNTSGTNNATIIVDYIENLNYTTIDYVIATHQDADHVSNFATVYENFQVGFTYLPHVHSSHDLASSLPLDLNPKGNGGKISTSKTYATFLNSVYSEGTPYTFFNKDTDLINEEYGYSFDFLTPTISVDEIAYTDPNDYSPIINFSYANFDVLFTGDAEIDALAEFISFYPNKIDVDLLKVGHHGSYTSTTRELLDFITPEYAVIQVGKDNSYRHPRQQTLDLLYECGAKIYRNDLNGNIVLTVNSDGSFYMQAQRSTDYATILRGL